MKTILLFDVAASSGGALTILNQYYEHALRDNENNWIFIISNPNLKSNGNVIVYRHPWIKISWFHRIYFDTFIEPKILKDFKYTDLISLQNTPLKTKKKQTIYLHNALPFLKIKFNFISDFKMWFYNKITNFRIKKGLKNKKNKYIVQTEWIKNILIEKYDIPIDNVEVNHPNLNEMVYNYTYKGLKDKITFFYPASHHKYKNHNAIIRAAKIIPKEYNYEVIFTIDKNHKKSKWILNEVNKYNLPIKLVGNLNYENVLKIYENSILIFPSYLETYGLPLLEAKTIGCPIIASDRPFSYEVLKGYDKANFFDPFNYTQLSCLMMLFLTFDKKCE